MTQTAGTSVTAYGYTNEYTSQGLIYLRSRWYVPYLNQFIQPDTIVPNPRIPADWNKYTYTRNNPINFTDPNGLQAIGFTRADNGEDPFSRFDRTLDYIYNEMVTNSQGQSADVMRTMLKAGDPCSDYRNLPAGSPAAQVGGFWGGYLMFALKVRAGGEWDHKPKLRSLLNLSGSWDDLYYPIRGDNDYEYYYDIWSNIHYGYVGSSIGFDRDTLQIAANAEEYVPDWLKPIVRKIAGQYDPGDVISVDIGVKLWRDHRYALSRSDLHNEILAQKRAYFQSQDINGNAAIDLEEIDPVKGKLLPRGTTWSNWH